MRMTAGHLLHRLLSSLLFVAFLAMGQGVAGLELAWHVGHVNDRHERAPHVEAAGSAAHGDNCQLTVAHSDGRLPVLSGPAALPAADGTPRPVGRMDIPPGSGLATPTRSRAPPILG